MHLFNLYFIKYIYFNPFDFFENITNFGILKVTKKTRYFPIGGNDTISVCDFFVVFVFNI